MRLATVLTPITDEGLQLAAQCGVTDIVHRYPGPDRSLLQKFLYRLQPWQLRCSVIEGYLPIENLKLGQDDGREMRLMQDLIRQMGDLGVEILCYNFMAGSDWCRTQLNASERGGALVTAFDRSAAEQAVLLGYRPPDAESEAVLQGLTPEMLFENLQRLLDGLLPVAEASGRSSIAFSERKTSHHALCAELPEAVAAVPVGRQWYLFLPGNLCRDECGYPGDNSTARSTCALCSLS